MPDRATRLSMAEEIGGLGSCRAMGRKVRAYVRGNVGWSADAAKRGDDRFDHAVDEILVLRGRERRLRVEPGRLLAAQRTAAIGG
jgi:hypothetical protein